MQVFCNENGHIYLSIYLVKLSCTSKLSLLMHRYSE